MLENQANWLTAALICVLSLMPATVGATSYYDCSMSGGMYCPMDPPTYEPSYSSSYGSSSSSSSSYGSSSGSSSSSSSGSYSYAATQLMMC